MVYVVAAYVHLRHVRSVAKAPVRKSLRQCNDNALHARRATKLLAQGEIQEAFKVINANQELELVEAQQARTETSVRTVDDNEASGESGEGGQGQTSVFQRIWRAHPNHLGIPFPILDANGNPDPANQCAIRLTWALMALGKEFQRTFEQTFNGRKEGAFAIRAEELAEWLPKIFGKPIEIKGRDKESQLQGRTGIVFLKSFKSENGRANHIDAWNGLANRFGKGQNRWINTATKVLFWEIP